MEEGPESQGSYLARLPSLRMVTGNQGLSEDRRQKIKTWSCSCGEKEREEVGREPNGQG